MSSSPIVDRIRIIPRPVDFLDRNVGSSGQVYFNRESSSLRVYNGRDLSGFEIARADLDNVSDADLEARITALGISGSSGGASVDVSETAPTEPEAGNLWLNTTNGRLYIYVNDGDTSQWMQPAVPVFSGSYNDLSDKPALATVATSGSYNDLSDKPTFGDSGFDGSYNSLTDKPTIPSFTSTSTITLTAPDGVTITDGTANVVIDAGYITADGLDVVTTINAQSGINISGATGVFWKSGATTLGGINYDTSGTQGLRFYTGSSLVTPALSLDTSGRFVGLKGTTEVLDTKTSATGTVVHDFATSAIFYHSGITADFTANFTNVPETDNRTISVVLLLEQGGTAYIPTAVQIDGQAQTINWQGASAPTGNANQIDVVSFTLIRTGAAWTVIGSLTTYG